MTGNYIDYLITISETMNADSHWKDEEIKIREIKNLH